MATKERMRNRNIRYMITAAAVSFVLLAGCADSRKEEEAAYRQIGIDCMDSGDYDGAVAAFNSALKQHIGKVSADEIDICYYKAAAQYAGGDIAAAIETYNAILSYNSKSGDAYYLRGCLFLKQGDTESGLEDFANAVKYNSGDYKRYINIYENLSSYGIEEEGKNYLNQALLLKGNDMESLEARGRIYYLLGDYENAVKELNSALEKESVLANFYLAMCYEAMGDVIYAENYYQAYIASGNMDSVAFNALGEIMMDRGSYAEAVSYLEQGLGQEQISNRRTLMKNLVIAYEYSGDFVSAWSVMEEYMALYPEDTQAQREYIFLKNRQRPVQTIEGETESIEDKTEGS